MTTGLSAGLTPPRPAAGRPRRTTRWTGAGTGAAGIAAALAVAAAAEGAAIDGDSLVTDDTSYDHVILDGGRGTHQVPLNLGLVNRSECSGFDGVDPVGVVDSWAHGGEANTPTYTVADGVLTMGADASGDVAVLRWSVAQHNSPHLLRIEDLAATGGTQSTLIELWTGTSSGRYIRIRNQSNVWELHTSTGSWVAMGQSTLTPATLELRYDATLQAVIYRWGSAGTWRIMTPYTAATSITAVVRITTTYVSGAATTSLRSLLVSRTT